MSRARPARRDARRWALLVAGGLGLVAGCGDVCEDAAQLCADERQVAAGEGQEDVSECGAAVEAHAECLVEAESCAPDIVDDCWKTASAGTSVR